MKRLPKKQPFFIPFSFRRIAAQSKTIPIVIFKAKRHEEPMKFIAVFLLLLSSQALAAWDLNDVSYVMPLPVQVGQDALLKLNSAGKGGSLLSETVVNDVPVLDFEKRREETNKELRVVAVRIDPCFPLPTPQSCQKQIRLMWQPIQKNSFDEVIAVDAALHSFYVLSDSEFNSLLKDLQIWKKKFNAQTKFVPLQVHPAWAQEQDCSPALQDFQKIILKYAGMGNLSRVTAMVLRGGGRMWAFVGYEFRNNQLDIISIPRLNGRNSQTFVNLGPTDSFANGGITPAPLGDDTFNMLPADSSRIEVGSEDIIRQQVKAAFRIENPKNFSPENMDCVSCHVAQPAIHWVLNKRAELKVDQLWSSEIYQNAKYNLQNQSPQVSNTLMIRGLGYFGGNLAISQRVVNESAEVADMLNAIPLKPQ